MRLTLHFPDAQRGLPIALLGGEEERHEEFWFGQGFAWAEGGEGRCAVHFSLVVDVPRIVARTKRRDREERFSVPYCDSYPYAASGLMALFLARVRVPNLGKEVYGFVCDLLSYPERPHSEDIARRLFSPAGYRVDVNCGRLRLEAEKRLFLLFDELPVLLLALDRRTRLFLTPDELAEIGQGRRPWISSHPAAKALELALAGKPTPLRMLLPAGAERINVRAVETETETRLLGAEAPIFTSLISSIPLASSQRKFAQAAFLKTNIDRNWLIYLPSAISSLQVGTRPELEHPEDAFAYYRDEQIEKVVVEEKHMGSRGIVILCRTLETARDRFGVDGEVAGCAYTRNGRRFFKDEDTEAVFLERLERVLSRSKFWERFSTNWACFDGEILPWAVKALDSNEESDLVEAGLPVLRETAGALAAGPASALKVHWKETVEAELAALSRYNQMFKKYRNESADLAALRFAPFHLLAVEGQTFFNRSHLWHMETLGRLARSGQDFLIPTRFEIVRPGNQKSWGKCLTWWDELSARFDEGLVVKPLPFVPRGRRGLAQPALKCRSHEHLRLVYGPKYDSREAHELLLARDALKRRRNKHRRILRQFALSMEAVTRFVQRNSLNAVHECVLGILAQEVPPTMSQ
jgi:hypothetical protein